jgi:uncharacterized protein with HEPN domain
MKDVRERLRDILDAIDNIERYASRGRDVFEKDELIQSWFLRNLQIIGEAVRSMPKETQSLAPEIPWKKIIGMRNILVHDYFEIDTEVVWSVVENDIPKLRSQIETLIEKSSDA